MYLMGLIRKRVISLGLMVCTSFLLHAPAIVCPVYAQRDTPLVVPPITFVDVNSGRFKRLFIELEEGLFLDSSVRKMRLTALGLDVEQGLLDKLNIQLEGLVFQDFRLDSLEIIADKGLPFEQSSFRNRRMLDFRAPVEALATASISQDSLNEFLNSPRVLSRLSVSLRQNLPLVGKILSADKDMAVEFSSARIKLLKGNKVSLELNARLQALGTGLNLPLGMETELKLVDGWVKLTDTKFVALGQDISTQLAQFVIERIDRLSDWGRSSDDVDFRFSRLKVAPGKRLELGGTALIKRLRFGKS